MMNRGHAEQDEQAMAALRSADRSLRHAGEMLDEVRGAMGRCLVALDDVELDRAKASLTDAERREGYLISADDGLASVVRQTRDAQGAMDGATQSLRRTRRELDQASDCVQQMGDSPEKRVLVQRVEASVNLMELVVSLADTADRHIDEAVTLAPEGLIDRDRGVSEPAGSTRRLEATLVRGDEAVGHTATVNVQATRVTREGAEAAEAAVGHRRHLAGRQAPGRRATQAPSR